MLGQTEIERIADEILSELQAGDRTEAGSRAGAQEAGQAACVYGTGGRPTTDFMISSHASGADIRRSIHRSSQGAVPEEVRTIWLRPEAVKERIREHSPLLLRIWKGIKRFRFSYIPRIRMH